ncbi:ABC transporter substrate-binding protein [Neobacillus bataviensis]|uniref:ABC transporter substrate-binding protein n=1 Tax=Neobacillus bataviensis TaxID=220685 RepID=UPI001CC0827D|nr:ABC transporter substrate-binding protein [Neobacillus bataviensis]
MRNSIKWINIGVVFIMCVVLVLAGCSSSQTSKTTEKSNIAGEKETNKGPKVLKVAVPGNATHLDPAFSSSGPDRTVNQPIYNGLVHFKPGTTDVNAIEGDLAEKWENNSDGTIWTFHLRKGVKWQFDYGEFTSADVKYTFDRLLDPKTGSAYTEDLKVIKEVQTPDKYTVVFQLNQPDPIFLQRLLVDDMGGAIVKKEAIEAAGKDSMVKPVGTGPFMLKEYKLNEKVVLEKNPNYFRGEPKLDEIEFVTMTDQNAVDIAMEKGEIQLATGSGDKLWLEKMKTKKDLKIDFPGAPINWLLHLNSSIKPLDDKRVREAIAHAIDMDKYVKQVTDPGVAMLASGPIASNLDGHTDLGVYKYDPELSKKLLKEAGYRNGLELPPNFVNTRPAYFKLMTYIQEQLRQVGIKMELKQADIPTYQANIRKGLNNVVLKAGTFKSASFAFSDFLSSSIGSTNYSHYNKSDDLIVQATQEMDKNKAKELYADIQKQIMADYAVIPLIETNNVLFRRTEVNLGYDIKGTLVYSYPIYETTDLQ